jgi:diguanylate cyclase (GGDEF)-like protein/PAS domain S-box-containing protein
MLKSLFVRLAVAGSVGSIFSVCTLGGYIAYEQNIAAKQAIYKEADLITNGLANSLAPYFVVKDYANIDQTVAQFTHFPNLDGLLVATVNGKTIVEANLDTESNNWRFSHSTIQNNTLPKNAHSTIENEHIITWLPVTIGHSQLGWIRSRITLDHILSNQIQIRNRTLFVALLSLILSSLVLLLCLKNPLRQIKRATDFAKTLPHNYGQSLQQTPSVNEIYLLIAALNQTSAILLKQDQELRLLNENLNLTLQAIPDLLFELDTQSSIINIWRNNQNQTFLHSKHLIGHCFTETLVAKSVELFNNALTEAKQIGISRNHVIQTKAYYGNGWFELSISYKPTTDPLKSRFFVIPHNITERIESEQKLRIAATVFNSQEGMLVADADNIILSVNPTFSIISGYSIDEMVGQSPRLLQSEKHDARFYKLIWKSILKNDHWEGEIWNRHKNGEVYSVHTTITAVKNSSGIITNYVYTMIDMTASQQAHEEIERLAFYDPLTDLPNRRLLLVRLRSALISSQRTGLRGAIIFIDLDNFKTLNDTLGHDIGDILLIQVARRLEDCLRECDTKARLGGDEFVVLLENLNADLLQALKQTELISHKILTALAQPYALNNYTYRTTPSIGVTLFEGNQFSSDELLKQADIAMYQAKTGGRNTLCFFDPTMQDRINTRVALENDLHIAIAENQFSLYYQPQVIHNQTINQAEVLIRWHHPERGIISPLEFIPLSEETGLILKIGQWVLEAACQQIKYWENHKKAQVIQLAVNISILQFRQPNFVEDIHELLQRIPINPNLLKLELTESLVINDINDTLNKMHALRAMGVRFSMDDFGTGYSSLSSLKKLPFDQIKIDQSFVRDILTGADDVIIVQTIITMAKNIGIEVVAEGVETEEQRQLLAELGCQLCQGYLYSKPLPIRAFEDFLKHY